MTKHNGSIRLKARIRELYRTQRPAAVRFRYGLLMFDLATIAYLIVSSFFYENPWVQVTDSIIGVIVLADFLARFWISRSKLFFLARPAGVADIAVIASLFAPLAGESLAFLRVLRLLRLLRSYPMLAQLRQGSDYFRRNEDVILSVTNLAIFLFVMTAAVFETQVHSNPQITNYIDALYFTVTALTTTGFGDITLLGTTGKLISITIMICGVSLFIRLIQTIFRPYKVRHPCPACGLVLHDADAVHCKHCGLVLNIPDEGHV